MTPEQQLIALVTMICHTIILIACIAAVVTLAISRELNTGALTAVATLAGLTGSGLVINGKKYTS